MRLIRKTQILIPTAIFLLAISQCLTSIALPPERPNVLMILVDDLKPTLGCYGDKTAKTPHIDRLAQEGMRFDLAYCNQAVCAPSRFTLLLGSHSTSTGLYGLGSHLRKTLPNAITLPQYFAKHGYRTESLGKVFHVGHGNLGDPDSFSVPHFKDKVIEYLDPESTDGGKLTREEALFTNQKLGQIRSLPRGAAFEAPIAKDTDYADGRVAEETIRRLQAAKKRQNEKGGGKPFFIVAGFVRPHLPFSAPKRYWDLYDPKTLPMPIHEKFPVGAPQVALKRGGEINAYKPVPTNKPISQKLKRQLIHGYYASTSYVDAQIGKVTEALRELELDKNTIVVLWGDHGFHLGDLGIWTKHTNYEQANRIPMIIVAPGVTEEKSFTKQLAESVDIYPTLASLAGLPSPKGPQPIDGKNLVPVLKNPDQRVRDHAYHVYPRRRMLGRAIRTERYRLVEWKVKDGSQAKVEYELYDYQKDPHETKNHAEENSKVLKELLKKLHTYPKPVSTNRRRTSKSPQIAKRPIQIAAQVQSKNPHGVVLAQGGIERGYSLHFIKGKAAFDVRVQGKVFRVSSTKTYSGTIELEAHLLPKKMELIINKNDRYEIQSPGLIQTQPKDGLSIGYDELSQAGDYTPPNKFNGKVISTEVEAQ